MSNLIFDSHAHYNDVAFDEDRDALLSSFPLQGIFAVVNASSDITTSVSSVALAQKYPYIYAAGGIHPECAAGLPVDYLAQIEKLLPYEKTVAVGEIGLDYHYEDAAPRETQKKVFEEQLILANQHGLPVLIHDREAHGDAMELLHKHRPKGVVHCFSGSVEMANEVIKLGMYIGLGGAVTFKNARHPVEVAAAIPLDRMLLETDAPYMTPVPYRGKRCDSTLIQYTAAKIAQVRGITVEEVLTASRANAIRLFNLSLGADAV